MDVTIKPPSTIGSSISVPISNYGMAESHHYEVRVPNDLVVASLAASSGDGTLPVQSNIDGSVGHLHLRASPERFSDAEVVAGIVPKQGGPLTFAGRTAVVIAGVLAISIPARLFDTWFFPRGVEIPSTAVSLLIAAASAVLSLHVWDARHEVTAAIFSPAKRIQLLNLLVLAIIALLFCFQVAVEMWHGSWLAAYLISCITLRLYFVNKRSAKLPDPAEEPGDDAH